MKKEEIVKDRKSGYAVHNMILSRWSPRAMSGEKIDEKTLMTLFEAARWAPSSYNNQPWMFLYARRETENFETFKDLLIEFNQSWTKNAALLVVVLSKKTFDHNGKPSRTHSFDTGAAWENLALQGTDMGLVVHGMEGFDYEKAKAKLKIPDDYSVEAMLAIGKPAPKSSLPEELQKRESPSKRKDLSEIVVEGVFKKSSKP
jgi:nitroreductase